MDAPSDDVKELQEQLASTKEALRRAELDAEARAQAAKEQLRAAKEKAKSLFLSKVNVLEKKLSDAEERLLARQSENDELNVRLQDAEANALNLASVQAALVLVEHDRGEARAVVEAQMLEIEELREELRRNSRGKGDVVTTAGNASSESIADLESKRSQAMSVSNSIESSSDSKHGTSEIALPNVLDENFQSKSVEDTEVPTQNSNGLTLIGSKLRDELAVLKRDYRASQARVHELESQFSLRSEEVVPSSPSADSTDRQSDVNVSPRDETATRRALAEALACVEDVKRRELEVREKFADAQARLEELERANDDLSSELVKLKLKEEQGINATSVVKPPAATVSRSGPGDVDDMQAMIAKVADLERQIKSKQIEIGKVRDKARAYLKDLNAEKREVEARMREEMGTLEKKVSDQHDQLTAAEKNKENILKELDTCMGIISDKQRAINALNMAITNERAAVREAQSQIVSIQEDFTLYKERAHKALEERDDALAKGKSGVENATKELRQRVKDLEAEKARLEQMHSSAKAEAELANETDVRAQKAEAALDLVKQEASAANNVNLARIYSLEGEIDCMRRDLESSRATVADLRSEHATVLVRLEVAERSLKAKEMHSEEAARLAEKRITELLLRIERSEASLSNALETAAAAQRTAAVAARVMSQPLHETARSPRNGEYAPALFEGSPRSPKSTKTQSPSRFIVHSESQDLSMIDGASISDLLRTGENIDDESSDQQIAVLMSQIAELGTLLQYSQEESEMREQQTTLLKSELRDIQAKLAAAEKLQNGAPFSYMRTVVVSYLETGDPTLLPVICDLLSLSDEESRRVRAVRVPGSKIGANQGSYFMKMPFLGGS